MTDSIFCNRCGGQNLSTAQFCANCGSPFSSSTSAVVPQAIASTVGAQSAIAPQHYYGVQQYAGFWLRFIAAFIDGILVMAVVFPISFAIGALVRLAGVGVGMPRIGIHLVSAASRVALTILASWIYEATMESSPRQATLGKMVLGLKVTDLSGNRISFARASGRRFAKYVSATILYIGYIVAGLTERKQALHDIIAGTLVARG